MSIKLVNVKGKQYWRMYVCERARLPGGKIKKLQKNLLFDLNNKDAARKEERSWKRQLLKEASKLENRDLDFGEILERFKAMGESQFVGKRMTPQTLKSHISVIKKYCSSWSEMVASEITKGDGREVLRKAKLEMGASLSQQRRIKSSINLVYNWGIEEKYISGVHNSPVYGLYLEDDEEEKIPPILTLDQVRLFLLKARQTANPWYPVWAFAVLTGMRSGELFALKWSAVDLQNRTIRVSESYAWAEKEDKSTKAGYWRNVPISEHLMSVISFLKKLTGDCEHVLPRLPGWENGEAAKHLRMFLKGVGIEDYVVFHTLRACFATHLLSSGAEPAKVMAIGGWKDLKTFEIYIRLSGVSVAGVTDNLKVLPTEDEIVAEAGEMYEVAA
jgi:integrase